jgi:hypothetical protein
VVISVRGRRLKVYGSPSSVAASSQTAFGYLAGERKWEDIEEDVDVVVTHGPPIAWLGGERYGCAMLMRRLWKVKPVLHVFGHVHQGYGVKTLWYDDEQKEFERDVEWRHTRKVERRSGSGAYVPPHLRQRAVAADPEKAVGNAMNVDAGHQRQWGCDFWLRGFLVRAVSAMAMWIRQVGMKRTMLVNAAIKLGAGEGRAPIVVRI